MLPELLVQQQATKFINLTRQIDCARRQDFHRVTAMTFVLKFGDSLIKGLQFVFQSLNFFWVGNRWAGKLLTDGAALLCGKDDERRVLRQGGPSRTDL
jgi:hypothetical protein